VSGGQFDLADVQEVVQGPVGHVFGNEAEVRVLEAGPQKFHQTFVVQVPEGVDFFPQFVDRSGIVLRVRVPIQSLFCISRYALRVVYYLLSILTSSTIRERPISSPIVL